MKPIFVLSAMIFFMPILPASAQKKESAKRKISVTITAQNTSFRLAKQTQMQFSEFGQPYEHMAAVIADSNRTFQTIVGIGGALTDASAEVFAKLPASKQEDLLRYYFDPEKGIGYSLARTNMNSCDFSSASYTYVDDNDISLNSFDISHDKQYKIPLIRRAMEASDGRLKLFISPWSPPAWMKGNKNMLQGGILLKEYYGAWAKYFVKFIEAYEQEGIPVWGLTVQNEPLAKQKWESCMFTADDERNFIKNALGPALWAAGMKDKKLIAWDHNRDLVYHRAMHLLSDPEASKYIWGIGYHWYEAWKGAAQYDNVRLVAEAFPETNLILTEACHAPFDPSKVEEWKWGEYYGEAMIRDFNSGASGWTDWNILLDENGGPNHARNFCFSPVHANLNDGTIRMMNSFYYIGHFSKFVQPGARRIAVSSNRSDLLTTGFLNPDGTCAVIVMNKSDLEMKFRLYAGAQAAEIVSMPHSIMTFVY